jgi:hypothetical protein
MSAHQLCGPCFDLARQQKWIGKAKGCRCGAISTEKLKDSRIQETLLFAESALVSAADHPGIPKESITFSQVRLALDKVRESLTGMKK